MNSKTQVSTNKARQTKRRAQAGIDFKTRQLNESPQLYIGRVAELTGATRKAIRHYESLGLLPQVARTGNYRVYSERDVFLVHMIKHAQSFGFSLAELLALIFPDFLWYWVHRLSHEGRGRIGQWLWKVHVAHHLPQQVYLLMHGVAHPLNTIIVRAIMTVPLFLLGFPAEVLFVANLVVGLQGFVSHFNVDIRAGWFNYVLMGAEQHRYHHSADPAEAKNYGAVVTLWDRIFGTYFHRPGVVAKQLGVTQPAQYPQDRELLKVLTLPFK